MVAFLHTRLVPQEPASYDNQKWTIRSSGWSEGAYTTGANWTVTLRWAQLLPGDVDNASIPDDDDDDYGLENDGDGLMARRQSHFVGGSYFLP